MILIANHMDCMEFYSFTDSFVFSPFRIFAIKATYRMLLIFRRFDIHPFSLPVLTSSSANGRFTSAFLQGKNAIARMFGTPRMVK